MDNNLPPENAAEFLGPTFSIPESLKATYQHGNLPRRVIKVRNLSRGGICIEDSLSVPVGTSLCFNLNIQGKKIQAQGEVTWNIPEGKNFVHGIRFTFLPPDASEWFNTFVMDWAAEQVAENLDFSSLALEPIERRSFARLKIPLAIEVGFNEHTMLLQTKIFDISEGGLCLISNLELKNNQDVFLKLWLNESKFLFLRGLVKYGTKKNFEERWVNFHGIEFTDVKPEVIEELKKFLIHMRSQLDTIDISFDEIISKTDFPENS